jgi:hypothetical protein
MEGPLLAERMCQAQVPRPLARLARWTRACFVRPPRFRPCSAIGHWRGAVWTVLVEDLAESIRSLSEQGASAAGEDALGEREK